MQAIIPFLHTITKTKKHEPIAETQVHAHIKDVLTFVHPYVINRHG